MSDRARATSPARGRQRPDERTQVFTGSIFRTRAGMGLRFDDEPPPPPPEPVSRPAKVARMLALAHKLQRAIDRGEYESRADLARAYGLSRARITQLMDLLLLAPDIQEKVLFLESVDGREPFGEPRLRRVTLAEGWAGQRDAMQEIRQLAVRSSISSSVNGTIIP
jgi:hypothetical protein